MQLLLILSNDIEQNPGHIDRGLKVMFTNINSISANAGKRFDDLSFYLKSNQIQIAALCETGVNFNPTDYCIDGYHTLDKSLYSTKGRGMIIYLAESLYYRRRYDLEDTSTECMWIELSIRHKPVIIGSFYRSPSQTPPVREQFFSTLDNMLENTINNTANIDSIICGGDFNSRSKMWWPDDINSVEGNKLYQVMVKHALSQLIHEPTRITPTSKTCLDLLFTSTPGYVTNSEVEPPIMGSDHSKVCMTLNFNDITADTVIRHRVWKYDLANREALNNAINTHDWASIFRINDIELMTSTFTIQLLELFQTHIPHYEKVIKPTDMPWFNQNIKVAVNKRDKYYRKFVKTNNLANYRRFKTQSELVNTMVNQAKESYRLNICSSLGNTSSNKRSYWSIIKKLLGNKFAFTIPPLEDGGNIVSSNNGKARLFLNKFIEKFHHNYIDRELPICPLKTELQLNVIDIDKEKVHKIIMGLDISKSCGNDLISNRMLKLVVDSIDQPLYLLFSKILQSGHFPDIWKLGTLIPIFKNKGSRNQVSNYRPVTLLNTLPKILERIIYDSVSQHVIRNDLLYSNQSGFLRGHDTQKQLMQIVHMIKSNANLGMETRGVFLDMEGAFDCIPHFLLLHKLKSFGIGPELIKLVNSYLTNRKLRTKVDDNVYSEWSEIGDINSGVPQGSILGPLLFLLYIDDLSEVVENCVLFLYADDSSLFLPVHYSQDVLNASNLIQNDLNHMEIWAQKWKMKFKASKSVEVIFGTKRGPRNHPPVSLNNELITLKSSHKHLGAILDNKLNLSEHINRLVDKCNTMLNPLKSLSSILTSKHLEQIFMSFILPHLEYGSLLFPCARQCDIDKLDRVQYRAALLVSGCIHGTNKVKVLKCLGWMSLSDRRKERLSLLIHDSNSNALPSYLQQSINSLRNRNRNVRLRNPREFIIPAHFSNDMRTSPIPSAITIWETLPLELKNTLSRNSFKYKLRSYFRGNKQQLASTKLNLKRPEEIYLNRSRCDLVFKSHFYAHNFSSVRTPACDCGYLSETTRHVILDCPIHAAPRLHLFNTLETNASMVNLLNTLNPNLKINTLISGNDNFSHQDNVFIVSQTAKFLASVFA